MVLEGPLPWEGFQGWKHYSDHYTERKAEQPVTTYPCTESCPLFFPPATSCPFSSLLLSALTLLPVLMGTGFLRNFPVGERHQGDCESLTRTLPLAFFPVLMKSRGFLQYLLWNNSLNSIKYLSGKWGIEVIIQYFEGLRLDQATIWDCELEDKTFWVRIDTWWEHGRLEPDFADAGFLLWTSN